jgi:hypothetical protein
MAEPDTGGSVETLGIDIVPDASQFPTRLRAEVLPEAEKIGREIAARLTAPIASQLVSEVVKGVRRATAPAATEAEATGRRIGERLGKAVRKEVERELRRAISVKVDADTARAISKIREVERKLAGLSGTTVRVDVNVTDAIREVDRVKAKLAALSSARVRIDADPTPAIRAIDRVKARLTALGTTTIRIRLDTGSASADLTVVRNQIRALSGTANVTVRVRVTGEGALRSLESRLRSIGALARTGINVGVNVTGGAEVNRLNRDLRSLNARGNVTLRVRVDGVMQALADIQTIRSFVLGLRALNPHITVTVNATLALARLATILGLAAAVGAQHPTVTVNINISGLIPAQAGLATVSSQAKEASASMGFLAGAIALLALIAIPAIAGIAVAIAAIGTAVAAGVGGALVAVVALSGVLKAVQAVTAAQGEQGKSASQAASRQAAIASAADQVRSSERSLASAIKEEQKAQEGVNAARKEAQQRLEDLNLSMRDIALQQKQANRDVEDAKKALDAVLADPNATKRQKEEAQDAYDKAVLQVDELAVRQKRAAADKAEFDKKGIEGSREVVAANDQVAAANERVAQAQQQLAAAHRQAAQAAAKSTDSVSSGADKAREALAKLTPEGRAFVAFLLRAKGALDGVRKAAESSFLPPLQRGLEAVLPLMKPGGPIVRFVERLGTAMGLLAERALKAFASPFWTQFLDFLGTTGVQVFTDFATAIGYIVKGLASMLIAFGPASKTFSGGLSAMAKSFAEWAAKLAESKGFQAFINYATTEGPKVLTVLGKLTVVLVKLVIALVPLATLTIDGLIIGLTWLSKQNPGVILAIAAAIAVLVAVIVGGPAAIVVAVVAVGALLVWMYNKFKWFHDAVNAVWAAIVAYAKFLWEYGYKPTFEALVWLWTKVVAPAAVWLWENVLKPTWNAISTAAVWLWRNVLEPTFSGIAYFVTKVLGPAFSWFYEHVIKPVWAGISLAVSIAWAIIQVIFGLIKIAIVVLVDIVMWLWDHGFKQAFSWIGDKIASTWHAVQPIFQAFGSYISENVVPAVAKGVSAIAKIWDGMKEVAKAPIRFIVETVLNNGLLAAYNWIAKKFGVTPNDVHIPVPDWLGSGSGGSPQQVFQGHATGGYITGPGDGTSDSIFARLSNGEYVIPARIVEQFGVPFFDWLIGKRTGQSMSGNQRPGDGSEGLAFADGGLVGWLQGAWNTLTDPVSALGKAAGDMLGKVPGGAWVRDVASGVVKDTIGKVVTAVRAKITNLMSADGQYTGPISADVAAVQNWIRTQNGKPYIWASAGPEGYDCSGIVSAAYNMLHGKSPYSHTFSTSYEAPFFPKVGQVGVLTAGWANEGERGGGSVGHTAANIAGLPFESTGSRGVHVGVNNGVTPYTSFAHWGTYDRGGWLMPGVTYAQNDTGKPEAVLTEQQWSSLTSNSGDGPTYTTNVYPQRANMSTRDLAALQARQEALARIRRQN